MGAPLIELNALLLLSTGLVLNKLCKGQCTRVQVLWPATAGRRNELARYVAKLLLRYCCTCCTSSLVPKLLSFVWGRERKAYPNTKERKRSGHETTVLELVKSAVSC